MKTPIIFAGHGSPENALATNEYTRSLNKLGKEIEKPEAILCISAHWQTRGTKILAQDRLKMIYDFFGFSPKLTQITYGARCALEKAARTRQLLPSSELVQSWGLDHGAWSVLLHLFPNADVPVYQLSLDMSLDESQHYQLAQNLYALRSEGVLILGSGNIVHNLQKIKNHDVLPYEWCMDFDEKIKEALIKNDISTVLHYKKKWEELSLLAVPTHEHFLPLIYCLANTDSEDHLQFVYEGYEYGSISMRTMIWG